ncbi:MAG TPA: FHA domain-containing protein [Acidimicrobiales bacterium]|nr:FHA domain-containing protein [Acidimicrobiales bacterium]
MDDVFCHNCGHRNPMGVNFCSSCGSVLVAATSDTTVTIQPVEELADLTDDDAAVTLLELPRGVGMLVVKRGPNTGSRYVLESELTKAGRHPESDIFLDDITVSRRHVEIVPKDGGAYVVRDVGSLNGTYVNRERIDEVQLAPGDELQIGKFKLVYLVAGNE